MNIRQGLYLVYRSSCSWYIRVPHISLFSFFFSVSEGGERRSKLQTLSFRSSLGSLNPNPRWHGTWCFQQYKIYGWLHSLGLLYNTVMFSYALVLFKFVSLFRRFVPSFVPSSFVPSFLRSRTGKVHDVLGGGADGRAAMERAQALLPVRPVPHGVFVSWCVVIMACPLSMRVPGILPWYLGTGMQQASRRRTYCRA